MELAKLRKGPNSRGFVSSKRNSPFKPGVVYDKYMKLYRPRREHDYNKEEFYMSNLFCDTVLMAFERALECGGWRAASFVEWFRDNVAMVPLELAVKIEDKLHPVIVKSDGHKMDENAYFEWSMLDNLLRKYLYDL